MSKEPPTCKFCKKQFKSENNLYNHHQLSKKCRIYTCDYCPFTTRLKFEIKIHEDMCEDNITELDENPKRKAKIDKFLLEFDDEVQTNLASNLYKKLNINNLTDGEAIADLVKSDMKRYYMFDSNNSDYAYYKKDGKIKKDYDGNFITNIIIKTVIKKMEYFKNNIDNLNSNELDSDNE